MFVTERRARAVAERRIHLREINMRSALLVALVAVSTGFAACSSGSDSPAMPGDVAGGVQLPQSCDGGPYAECITLTYHSPYEQELCVDGGGLLFGPSCTPSGSKPWNWLMHLKGYGRYRHDASKKIKVSFSPNPGNPSDVTISENQRVRSSNGAIAYAVIVRVCIPITGGDWCTLPRGIGILTQ
jgi:hypothetical protein